MRKLMAAVCIALWTWGCRYERIVSYNPPLAGLPGAKTQTPPVKPGSKASKGKEDPNANKIVIEHADGSVTLVSRNALEMLTHIRRLLAENNEELFTAQILSDRTKAEFIARGFDPAEAFKELKRRQTDVMALLARMPMGEFTPGLFLKNLERNTYRLQVHGRAAEGLEWTFVDIVIEHGVWKLRWFG